MTHSKQQWRNCFTEGHPLSEMFITIFQTCWGYVTPIFSFPLGLWGFLPVKGEQHCVCIPGPQFPNLSKSKWMCMHICGCAAYTDGYTYTHTHTPPWRLKPLFFIDINYLASTFCCLSQFFYRPNSVFSPFLKGAGSAVLVSPCQTLKYSTYWLFIHISFP